MILLRTLNEIRNYRREIPPDAEVGFVPTMGALHEGHAALLRQASAQNKTAIASIFVNPAQFAPHEDFKMYPRTLEADLELAKASGIHAVFAPSAENLYPEAYSTYVEETSLSKPLCGVSRPTHFRGVATVVLKLFNLVRPTRAYFGLKDAQQFFVLKKMVLDLHLDLEMIGVATVRESDGLALSSRNRYLAPEERGQAPLLYHSLLRAKEEILAGRNAQDACHAQIAALNNAGFRVQYFETQPCAQGQTLLAAAAFLGHTRLIDNVIY